MAARIPDDFRDLFAKPALAHLATLMPDGAPQVTPVWVDYDGEHILVNTIADRQKGRNMTERPAVALDIVDPDDPYRYLSVRGRVVAQTMGGAEEHIDALARRYMGTPNYPRHDPARPRTLYKIAPEHVVAQGRIGEVR
ncbi:MAG TPA: PPOX class F420-dependent oxidoreductase [Thermomicrobiales bacterium]|nr:PPOX class F420-dependent oxidoreductase [Thermomicrobiales bacterium]